MKSICVFCGSSPGARPEYADAARLLGGAMAVNGQRLVFGGGRVGLMGITADAVLAGGGVAVGVIPRNLMEREVGHRGLTELHVVETMHERKAMMAQLSDAFVALPGGIGTMEELFEVWTWGQLGLHRKPIGLLNVGGFYDPLLRFLDGMVGERFLREETRSLLLVSSTVDELLARLEDAVPPAVPKWIDLKHS